MWKRLILAFIFVLSISVSAKAQGFTQVSGKILDPSGTPYTSCVMNIAFVPSPSATTQAFINGALFPTTVAVVNCDSSGNFGNISTISLADNNLVSDGHTSLPGSMWRFNICSALGKYPGPQYCFTYTGIITGTSMVLTSQIQAVAALLPTSGGGGAGNPCVTTNRSFQINASGVFGCAQGITTPDGNTINIAGNENLTGNLNANSNAFIKGPVPWIDCTAYGYVGNGSTDDGPGINACIAAADALPGGNILIPYTSTGGIINTCLTLASTRSNWLTIRINAPLLQWGSGCPTQNWHTNYVQLEGLGAGFPQAFDAHHVKATLRNYNGGGGATFLDIQGSTLFFINLDIRCGSVTGTNTCVNVDNNGSSGSSVDIHFDSVNAVTAGTGVALLFNGLPNPGGFWTRVEHGSFGSASGCTASVKIINWGYIAFNDDFFGGCNIYLQYLHPSAAPIANVSIVNAFTEAGSGALLTMDSDTVSGAGIYEVEIDQSLQADGTATLVTTKGTNVIQDVSIRSSFGASPHLVDQHLNPIIGLHIESSAPDITAAYAGSYGSALSGSNNWFWGPNATTPALGTIFGTLIVCNGSFIANADAPFHVIDCTNGGNGNSDSIFSPGLVERLDSAYATPSTVREMATNAIWTDLINVNGANVASSSYNSQFGIWKLSVPNSVDGSVSSADAGGFAKGFSTSNDLAFERNGGTSRFLFTGTPTTNRTITWADIGGTPCIAGASISGCAGGGSVTSIVFSSPLSGGTVTTTGTVGCPTCVTSAASLTNNQLMFGAGGQASAVGDLTGDVTTSGGKTTALHNIPTGTTMAGSVLATEVSAPSTPASGTVYFWADSTNHILRVRNSSGTFSNTVTPLTAATHNWFNSLSASGVLGTSQPNFNDISGALLLSQITPPASTGDSVCGSGGVWSDCVPSVVSRVVSGTSDTVTFTGGNQLGVVTIYTSSSSVAVSITGASTNGQYGTFDLNGTGAVTFTPTTGQIRVGNGSLASSVTLTGPLVCYAKSYDGTNLQLDCGPNSVSTAGTNPSIQDCGSTTTCSATPVLNGQIVKGHVALASGTPSMATITGISPAFTSSTSYVCTVSAQSAATGALLSVANVSGSSFTITGPATVTTVINYICAGN